MGILLESRTREIALDMIPAVTRDLCRQVESAPFKPDCVVYLEMAARLLAVECCAWFAVRAVPLSIHRKGKSVKGRVAPLLACLPTATKDFLRRLEAQFLWKRMRSQRVLGNAPQVDFSGKSILVIDDAVDTGTSVRMARDWAVRMGASAEMIRIAALTVTTSLAEGTVDYHLHREMCRFPWSSDSRELEAYEEAYREAVVPLYEGTLSVAGSAIA